MKRLVYYFSALLFLSAGSLSAYLHPSAGNFGFLGEYIFLLPSVDDTYFVINAPAVTPGPTGTRERNDFSFSSGFRLEGVYAFCDCNQEFRASYTRLRTRETRTVAGANLWATLGSARLVGDFEDYTGTASSDNDLLWHRVDGLFGQQVSCGCCSEIYLYGGFEYAYIRMRGNVEYVNTILDEVTPFGIVNQKSRASGVGPEFGAEFDTNLLGFTFCSRQGTLSLVAATTGSLLVSQTKVNSSNFIEGATPLNVSDKRTWRIIPAWHARVGLNYTTCFQCFLAMLEVGYEFNTYLRGINWQAFPHTTFGTQVGLCYTNYKNFDVHGLYVNLGLTY